MKYHYVYRIKNLVNNKEYVGKRSCNCLIIDDKYMGSGVLIKQAIKKYGSDKFSKEILKQFSHAEDAYRYEGEIVSLEYVSRLDTYNLVEGGRGVVGLIHSEKTRKLMSEVKKGKKQSRAHVESRAEAHRGRKNTETTRKLMSESALSRVNTYIFTEEHKAKLSSKKLSTSHRKALIDSCIGRKMSEESRHKSSLSNSVQIYHTPYGEFHSAIVAYKTLKCSKTTIESRCLNPDKIVRFPNQKNASMPDEMKFSKYDVGKTHRKLGWYVEKAT